MLNNTNNRLKMNRKQDEMMCKLGKCKRKRQMKTIPQDRHESDDQFDIITDVIAHILCMGMKLFFAGCHTASLIGKFH